MLQMCRCDWSIQCSKDRAEYKSDSNRPLMDNNWFYCKSSDPWTWCGEGNRLNHNSCCQFINCFVSKLRKNWLKPIWNITGTSDVHPILKQLDGDVPKEKTINGSDNANEQVPLLTIVDSDRLLFSVFSLLHKLGADERPEVGNMFFLNHLLCWSYACGFSIGMWFLRNIYNPCKSCIINFIFSCIINSIQHFGICFGLHLHCSRSFFGLMT